MTLTSARPGSIILKPWSSARSRCDDAAESKWQIAASDDDIIPLICPTCRISTLALVCGVLPMAIATGAGGASQQALGTSVMGGMIAVVILALLMVPVFFVSVQRVLAGDREKVPEAAVAEPYGPPAPVKS